MTEPVTPLVAFGRTLRLRGLPIGTGRILTFCRAVAALGLTDRGSLYWAGRTSMVARREDIGPFDVAFDDWYRSLGAGEGGLTVELALPTEGAWSDDPEGIEVPAEPATSSWEPLGEGDEEAEPGDEAAIRIVASAVEVLREKSFGELTPEERAKVARDP